MAQLSLIIGIPDVPPAVQEIFLNAEPRVNPQASFGCYPTKPTSPRKKKLKIFYILTLTLWMNKAYLNILLLTCLCNYAFINLPMEGTETILKPTMILRLKI